MQRPSYWTPDRVLLLVAIVATAIYWRDLSHDFILDDVPLVLMNPALATWRNLPAIFRTDIFHFPYVHGATGAIHYRPIYTSWLLLNHMLFGMVLPWWRLTSLALHLIVTVLVYRLAVRLLDNRWLAVLAASIFAFHPVHAEAVAYLTASTDLLEALFSLVALVFYMRFREEGHRPIWLALSLAGAAAAVLSKESAGMVPWLLVAYEALRLAPAAEPRTWRRYRWTLPYFAVGAFYVILRTLLFGANVGPGPGGSRSAVLADIPLAALVYLKNFFLPTALSFFYPAEWSTQWTWPKGAAIVLLCAAVIWIWVRHKDRPVVRLLLAWTVILFVPPALALTTFYPDGWVHDRHIYLVSVPVCLLVAMLLAQCIRQRRAFALAGAGITLLLAIGAWMQVPRFQDEVSVYASALKVAPQNSELHHYFASALWKYNRKAEAIEEFQTAIALRPGSIPEYTDYASALEELGDHRQALAEYRHALALAPPGNQARPQLLYHVARMEIATSDLEGAAAQLREAISIAPRALNYHAALADALRQRGDTQAAEEELRLEEINRKQYIERHSPRTTQQ